MERPEILGKVAHLVRDKLHLSPTDVVDENTRFTEDLHADSLDQAEIVMEFEEVFEIQIPDDVGKTVKTVGEAADAIKKILDRKQ